MKPLRIAFEHHWVKTRGKRAMNDLQRHPAQPETYISDAANRHWVTWQAAQPKEPEKQPVAWLNPVDGALYKATDHERIKWLQGLIPLVASPLLTEQLKPLNQKQSNQFVKNAGYRERIEPISDFINDITFAESAHGITGEQK